MTQDAAADDGRQVPEGPPPRVPVDAPEEEAVGQQATAASPIAAPARATLRRRSRRLLVVTIAVVLLAVGVVGISYAWVHVDAGDHEFTVADAPSADVGMVLGAGLREDGTPSEYLRYRLDDAAALYAAGKVKVLLVSGDNRRVGYDEPTAMRDYLVAHGVPADKVVRDFTGQDTYDSCVRAKDIFGVTRLLVITQQFHLSRAVFLCRQVGIETDGVADDHPLVTNTPALREIPAAVKAGWDAIWQPDPAHLGPSEDGITEALGSN